MIHTSIFFPQIRGLFQHIRTVWSRALRTFQYTGETSTIPPAPRWYHVLRYNYIRLRSYSTETTRWLIYDSNEDRHVQDQEAYMEK